MSWLLRRMLTSAALIWVVATMVFLAIRLVPGDPAELLLSQGGVAPDPAAMGELHEQLGLDRPIFAQYFNNCAISQGRSRPIVAGRQLRLGKNQAATATNAGTDRRCGTDRRGDRHSRRIVRGDRSQWTSTESIVLPPSPWPCRCSSWARSSCCCSRKSCAGPSRRLRATGEDPLGHIALFAMPAMTIALGLSATVFRMTRAAVLDEQRRDHVRTARAKGSRDGACCCTMCCAMR